MGEVKLFGMSFLERQLAGFLQYRQIVAHGIHCQPFLVKDILLKIPDELFVELSESYVRSVELLFNQPGKGFTGVVVTRNGSGCDIHAYTGFQIINQQV